MKSKIITAQVDNIAPKADAHLPVYNGATGELMHKVPTPYYLRLRRREFARVLGDGIDIQVNFSNGLPYGFSFTNHLSSPMPSSVSSLCLVV